MMIEPGLYYAGNINIIYKLSKIDPNLYSIIVGGNCIESLDALKENDVFQLNFSLFGGKGGFGSLLKSFRIHKSSNQLMSRDLTGRRLADVNEEERLRRWIARKAERDRKKKQQDDEKLRKLKTGNKYKHHFKDKKYMRQRDLLLEKVDDALEAGIKAVEEKAGSSDSGKGSLSPPVVDNADDSDTDIDLDDEIPLLNKKKRKVIDLGNLTNNKKAKIEDDEPGPSSSKKETKIPKVLLKKKEIDLNVEEKTFDTNDKEEDTRINTQIEKTKTQGKVAEKKDYLPIDLDQYNESVDLELLGLDHLKHELESRRLKCGGSLKERAERLFSIKGLTPDEYPKKIKANKQ